MKRRFNFYFAVSLLALAGIGIAVLRHVETGIPFVPGLEQSVWDVEARIDFTATGGEASISLSLPEQSPGFTLLNEQAASPGYGFSIVNEDAGRRGEWTKREVQGDQSLYYSARFVEIGNGRRVGSGQAGSEDELEEDMPLPSPVFWEDAQGTAAEEILTLAFATSSSSESFTRELSKLFKAPEPNQNMALLLAASNDDSELFMKLLNQAGLPARIVMGLTLEDARRRQLLTPMIEIFVRDRWLLFSAESGEFGLPENFLLWHREGLSLLDVNGGVQSRVSFSIIQQSLPALQLVAEGSGAGLFSDIGIHRLPIEEQSMFKLLLLLPLGALVVVFMRVIVGLKTAGTFMPILISMAFLQSSLWPGLISFVSVVAIGLLLRSYLSNLNLLLVARIATLLVLVVFVISALSIIGYEMGYSTGMTITFFPMIIIAWTIERMSILWEEEGAKEVVVQGGGSLFVAVITYQLMSLPLLTHLTFNFPEVSLVLLAAILAMGQYTGYKLSELKRFKAMDD